MPDNDACLLDTNILLRSSKSDGTQYAVIGRALRSLLGQRVRLCYTLAIPSGRARYSRRSGP